MLTAFLSVKAILDANRNSLMLLDLKFSIGTLGIGAGTFVAALYGMNLKNFIEESDLGFWGVSAWCFVFSVIVCWYGLRKLQKVQRVSMWGGRGAPGRKGWRELEYGSASSSPGAHGVGLGAQRRADLTRSVKERAMTDGGLGTEGVTYPSPTAVSKR